MGLGATPVLATPSCPPWEARTVTIGPRTWQVEVAASPESRSRGLAGRASLAPSHALWFVMPEPGSHGFWMQGMRFPIDLVWVTPQGRVAGVETLVPCTRTPCPVTYPPEPVAFVLETRAGEVPEGAERLRWSCRP